MPDAKRFDNYIGGNWTPGVSRFDGFDGLLGFVAFVHGGQDPQAATISHCEFLADPKVGERQRLTRAQMGQH